MFTDVKYTQTDPLKLQIINQCFQTLFLRGIRAAFPGDAGLGGDAPHAAGAGPGPEAQGGRSRGLEKSREKGGDECLHNSYIR